MLPAALPAARRALLPVSPLLPLPLRPLPPCRGAPAGLRALGTGPARRSEALAGAPLDTAAKEYSPKVRQLVRDIAGLTLLEVADLNALLKVGAGSGPARPGLTLLGSARPGRVRRLTGRWCRRSLFPQETLKIPDVGVMPAAAAASLMPAQAAPQVPGGAGAGPRGPRGGLGWWARPRGFTALRLLPGGGGGGPAQEGENSFHRPADRVQSR